MKKDLIGITPDELTAWCKQKSLPSFRAKQIFQWLYERLESSPDAMSNLSLPVRSALNEDFITEPVKIHESIAGGDGTEKLLLTLSDDECVEMVLIPSPERMTFCLSTQVGCPVGCIFCASGAHGFVRNLSTAEILGEFLAGVKRIGKKPDNIVFMGIGEGLLNFDALAQSLARLTDEAYFGLSPRRITVSTSGYVPGIMKLAELDKPFTLAISLHAAEDSLRRQLVPNMHYSVEEILKAAAHYAEQANRMVTLEYTMLDDVNDRLHDASLLAAAARRIHAKVNLIPYNSTGGAFKATPDNRLRRFAEVLERAGVTVTIRRSRGAKGSAACGQLRATNIRMPKL